MKAEYYAACSFGLEAAAAAELKKLGLDDVEARDARVYFHADEAGLARANICLASADRIYMVLKRFHATTFEELFSGIVKMDWAEIIPKNAQMPVLADSVRSVLKSVPDIQSISKKAIVEALKRVYGLSFYKEDGDRFGIYVTILKDEVTVALNTSGIGLNRRGYRVRNSTAPLRETLAAGLIHITGWYDRPFYDVTCGSGTIAIEAAMKARNIAPGIKRSFDAEKWNEAYGAAFARERMNARDSIKKSAEVPIYGADIDSKTVDMAKFHSRRAGVEKDIRFEVADARRFTAEPGGTIISNPPYAIRIGQADEAHELYKELGKMTARLEKFKYYFITADEQFERWFGRVADKRRKLYNGNVKCCFYQYFRRQK